MSGLVEFLRARLDEDEARQRDPWSQWHNKGCEAVPDVLYPDRETGACDCGVPARVLAEVAAKRQIIRMWEQLRQFHESSSGYSLADGAASKALQLHAVVYADHPDYEERWRP